MTNKVRLASAGLVILALFSLHTSGESSSGTAFLRDPGVLAGTAIRALEPVGTYLAKLGSWGDSLFGKGESWMEAKLIRASSSQMRLAVDPTPEDVDYGLDRDQFLEGGELVAETVNLLNGNVLETRLDLRRPSANRMGLIFEAIYNSRSDVPGTLGYGWSHTYSASLVAPGGG
jgi:hypothetical protein